MSDRSPKLFFPINKKESGDYTKERKQWLEKDPDEYLAAVLAHGKRKRPR